MIDITLFGWFVGTLTSTLSLVLLLTALGSAAFVGVTVLEAARERDDGSERRRALSRGAGMALAALAAALMGLRVGSGAGELVPTTALALAAAAVLGVGAEGAWALGSRGIAALRAARARQSAAAALEGEERRNRLEAGQRAVREGHDLHDEVTAADAAVERLRAAVETLAKARAGLQAKVDAAQARSEAEAHKGGFSGDTGELSRELIRARDEVGLKLEMGQLVLATAEAAALRIACNEPLRRLLRRRPREATQALTATSANGATEPDEEAIGAATTSIEAFLGEVQAARIEVTEASRHRREAAPEGATESPAAVALDELAAMETAYGALLERIHVAEVRISTRAGVAEVESAAGALSEAARAAAVDPAALGALVTEVTRAEAAVAMTAPEAGSSRALAEALAAGSAALERSDAASLGDLIVALREMR